MRKPKRKRRTGASADLVVRAGQRLPSRIPRPGRIEKKTIDGRILFSEVIVEGGRDKVRYFHATKGWRTRPIAPRPGRVVGRRQGQRGG